MAKSLLYRLFGVGRIPAAVRPALESEGVLFLEEGIRSSITYRRFRGHGRHFSWRRAWFAGSIALTQRRFVAFAFRRKVIDVPRGDPRLGRLELRPEDDGSILFVGFEASDFATGYSGRVEMRFRTGRAGEFLGLLGAAR